MCQEVGHDVGLAHQDEEFYNANIEPGTCMDYVTSPGIENETPNPHDYDMLASRKMYGHDHGGGGGGSGKASLRPPNMPYSRPSCFSSLWLLPHARRSIGRLWNQLARRWHLVTHRQPAKGIRAMARPVMQRRVRKHLEPLVVPLPIERQRLEAGPALLLVEPTPRQEQPRRVNPVVDANVAHDPEGDPVTPRRLESALDRAELPDPDVMRRPVLAVDVALLLQHPA